jgi:hypothetical protein
MRQGVNTFSGGSAKSILQLIVSVGDRCRKEKRIKSSGKMEFSGVEFQEV